MNATQEVATPQDGNDNTQHEKGLFIFPQLPETQDGRMKQTQAVSETVFHSQSSLSAMPDTRNSHDTK